MGAAVVYYTPLLAPCPCSTPHTLGSRAALNPEHSPAFGNQMPALRFGKTVSHCQGQGLSKFGWEGAGFRLGNSCWKHTHLPPARNDARRTYMLHVSAEASRQGLGVAMCAR